MESCSSWCVSVFDVGSEWRDAVRGVFQYLTWVVSGEVQFGVCFSSPAENRPSVSSSRRPAAGTAPDRGKLCLSIILDCTQRPPLAGWRVEVRPDLGTELTHRNVMCSLYCSLR